MVTAKSYEQLLEENSRLQARLAEVEETLRAIHSGEVDALVVSTAKGNQVFTLQNADRPYRLLVEEMKQGAATIAGDGTVLYCNRYFAEMLGHPPDHVVAQPIHDYFVPAERERLRAFLQAAESRGSSHDEFTCQSQAQQFIPVYVSANYLSLDHTTVICLIVADLSAQKQAEQRVIELSLEKQRSKLLADFVRDTSHDLRTPITAILSGLYLLQRNQDEMRRSEKIRDVERLVLYLNRVLEQFQQMAVLDSMTELSLRKSDLNRLVMDAVFAVSEQVETKPITISTSFESPSNEVQCDPELLFRALVELLQNAIRFMPSGGQIQVRLRLLNEHELALEVEDDGIGISPDKLPHVFERFYKVDETRGMTGGAGLGLPMVKRISELHRGLLEVESIPGKKTIFRIVLPVV